MGNKIKENQEQYVVKSNDLIQHTRYDMTTQQQKIVLYAISKIKPNDPPQTQYEISIDEICAACGIEIDGTGYYYKAIKDDLVNLTQRIWVKLPDKSEATVSWIGDALIVPLSGKVYIKFHERMAPYLFELNKRYTQYQLKNVLVFKSRYSIRLYELLRSYITQQEINNGVEKEQKFTVDELRELMAVKKYDRWADFDRYVIRKAVDEINRCSDEMRITYDTYKSNGRSVSHINFIIGSPSARQRMDAHSEARERLRVHRNKRPAKSAAEATNGAGYMSKEQAEAEGKQIKAELRAMEKQLANIRAQMDDLKNEEDKKRVSVLIEQAANALEAAKRTANILSPTDE